MQSVNINIERYKKTPDAVPSSSLPAQVTQMMPITDVTGTDAADLQNGRNTSLQNNGQRPNDIQGIAEPPLRRSRRIADRAAVT